MMQISIEGDRALTDRLKKWEGRAPNVVRRALRRIVLDLRGKAQRLAPVKKGFLRRSAFSESNATSGTVGFTEIYATRQHEETTWHHPKGGQAKYLEDPYRENLPKYLKSLEKDILESLR